MSVQRSRSMLLAWLAAIAAAVLFFCIPSPSGMCSEREVFLHDSGDDLGFSQKEALLTIFYNASTYGSLHPCPT